VWFVDRFGPLMFSVLIGRSVRAVRPSWLYAGQRALTTVLGQPEAAQMVTEKCDEAECSDDEVVSGRRMFSTDDLAKQEAIEKGQLPQPGRGFSHPSKGTGGFDSDEAFRGLFAGNVLEQDGHPKSVKQTADSSRQSKAASSSEQGKHQGGRSRTLKSAHSLPLPEAHEEAMHTSGGGADYGGTGLTEGYEEDNSQDKAK